MPAWADPKVGEVDGRKAGGPMDAAYGCGK